MSLCRQALHHSIHNFTVVCSMTWPLNSSDAEGHLPFLQNSLLLLCKYTQLTLKQLDSHNKSSKPPCHSKFMSLSRQLENSILIFISLCMCIVFNDTFVSQTRCNMSSDLGIGYLQWFAYGSPILDLNITWLGCCVTPSKIKVVTIQ